MSLISISEYSKWVGIPEEVIQGRDRTPAIAIARQVHWYYLKKMGISYNHIGKIYNRRHTSIMSGVKTISNLIETGDPLIEPYREVVENLSR